LRRVIENLLDNAIRHAPAGSAVRIGVVPMHGATLLRIANAGQTIPVEQRERVFEAFVQGSTEQALVARTSRGLGLAFCRLAVEAHGGAIWVEDADPGAVFCVRLPNDP
jgi:signal transduction histidine kinase